MEIRPVGAAMAHANRRTDMRKLTVTLRNFANELQQKYCHKCNFQQHTAIKYAGHFQSNTNINAK
jgi:hypothetical protein